MTSRTQELLLKINGKLDAKFGKAFQTANGKVFDLGQTMAKSTEQVERLNRVVAGRRGVEVLSQKLATAKTRLEALNAQMQATVSPSAKLQRSFQQAQRQVDIYKQRLEQSRQALEREEQATNTVGKTISQVSKIRRQQTGIVDKGARRLEAYSNQLQALDEQMERVKARRQEGIASILEGAALLRGFYEPIQTAMEFEVKTAELQKFTDQATELMQLNLNESLNSALSAADMGDIQAAALQAGVVDANNIKQIQEYTKIVNNAALAFDMTGETAGSAFATIQAQITGSMDATARMFDVVNAISNTTNASAQDLLTVIQRSGGIVKNFTAISDESLVAMSAAFRAASSSAEEAATSQAAFIAALTKGKGATNTQIEGFERLGINVQKLSSALLAGPESAQSAIVEVFNALKNLNETERADVMSKIFGGDKGTLNAIASILGQTDKLLMQPLNIASNEQNFNGSMAKEAATQASTTANQMKILENNIQNLKIIIGNELLPVWNTILSHVIEFAQLLSHTSKEFPSFTKGILAVVAGLGLLKVIMGGFSFVFGIVSSVVLLGRKTVLLFQGAMLVLNGTMAVTSMSMKALVLMSKLFIAGFGKARAGAILLAKGLATLPGLLLSIGTSALSAGKSLLAIAFLKVKSLALIASKGLLALGGAFSKLALAMLTNPIGLIITAIGLLIAIGIALYKNWDTVKAKVSELWASFKEKFPSLATIATVAFGLIFKAFRIFPKAINVISEAVQWFVDSDWATIWTTIKDLAAEGLDSLISWISSTFSDAWSTAWSGITGIFGDIFNGLIELAKAPIDWVTEKINSAISTITNGFNSVKNFFFGDDKEEAALKAEKNINVNQQALSPALSQPAMFNPALSGPTAVSPVVQPAPNLANVPQLASGGIVSEPTLAMIGEGNESEAVLPLSKLQGFLKGDTVNNQRSSQSITVNFNPVINVDGNSNADPYAQVKKALSEGSQDLRRQLIDLMNRQGRLSYD